MTGGSVLPLDPARGAMSLALMLVMQALLFRV